MGLSGIPEGGNSIPQDTARVAKKVKGDPISGNYTDQFKEYFTSKTDSKSEVKSQDVGSQMQKLNAMSSEKQDPVKGSSEEAIVQELKDKIDNRNLARMRDIYINQRNMLMDLLKSDSIPDDTKIAYENRLAFLNDKIGEMTVLLSQLDPEMYGDPSASDDTQLLSVYNIGLEETIEELKEENIDPERKAALESRKAYYETEIERIQELIKKQFEETM